MLPRHRGIVFSAVAQPGWLLVSLFLFYPVSTRAENTNNIICRENVSAGHRDELAGKLRRITGWPELNFDRGGILRQGSKEPVGGSKSARELIAEAISGSNVVVLEDASKRPDVVFLRVVQARWKQNASISPTVFVVLIDFADFDYVMGDGRALRAFDVGWGFLHEIDHIVNDSRDTTSLNETGECEDHINQMRRECNLPQRADYFFTFLPIARDTAFMTRWVRLAFDQEQSATKKKRYWLVWDAMLVGGLDESNQIAALR